MNIRNVDFKRERVSTPLRIVPSPASQALANDNAEKAVIGAVLQQPDIYPSLADILQPGDFCTLFHGYIWHSFDIITGRGEGIDIITVADELDKMIKRTPQESELASDVERLTILMGSAPRYENAVAYARQVRDSATLVRMWNASEKIKEVAHNKSLSVEEKRDEAIRLMMEATDHRSANETNAYAVAQRFMDDLEAAMAAGVVTGVQTGYKKLDNALRVIRPGEITVIGGHDGMGKTSWLLSVVASIAKQKTDEGKPRYRIAYFGLEMTQDEIMRVLLAQETGLSKDVLRTPHLIAPHQFSKISAAAKDISEWALEIVDEYTTLTPVQLRRCIRKLMMTGQIDLVVIDGLWLMNADKEQRDRVESVRSIMSELAVIAKDPKIFVPIWITQQYNGESFERQKKDGVPNRRDFAEAAAVRRNAHVMIGLWRAGHYGIAATPDHTSVWLLKNRNGCQQNVSIPYACDIYTSHYSEV